VDEGGDLQQATIRRYHKSRKKTARTASNDAELKLTLQ